MSFSRRLRSPTLSEQQYFVWDTATQSTKRQDILEVWEGHGPVGSLGYAYGPVGSCPRTAVST